MLKLLTMKNLLTLLSTIIILCTAGCQKEKLTKETQNGANTFSCTINGKVFKPCKGSGLFSTNPLFGGVLISGSTSVSIYAQCFDSDPEREINIELENFNGIGEYLLNSGNNFCRLSEYNPLKKYSSSVTQKGKVVITKDDRINYILSGTFEFEAANLNDANDIVKVESGRFDISYK